MKPHHTVIERALQGSHCSDELWSSPQLFSMNNKDDEAQLAHLVDEKKISCVFDQLDVFAEEESHREFPAKKDKILAEQRFSDIKNQGDEYGVWAYYPWNAQLVHLPDECTYYKMRTDRFRDLYTQHELMDSLRLARVALGGCSVGGGIATTAVRNGIGGAFAIADMANFKVSTIGRTDTDMRHVSKNKADVIAKQISYVDPFIEQVQFRDGITPESLEKMTDFQPSLIVDEVDDMRSSALLRQYSKNHDLPYVSIADIDSRVVVEVCRHDLGRAPLYASALGDKVATKLTEKHVSRLGKDIIFARSVGVHHLSPALLESIMKIDKTLGGIPQLGRTATVASGVATAVFQEIIIGRHEIPTGLWSFEIDKFAKGK